MENLSSTNVSRKPEFKIIINFPSFKQAMIFAIVTAVFITGTTIYLLWKEMDRG